MIYQVVSNTGGTILIEISILQKPPGWTEDLVDAFLVSSIGHLSSSYFEFESQLNNLNSCVPMNVSLNCLALVYCLYSGGDNSYLTG